MPKYTFVFSNWIFAWYLLFMLGIIKANPFLLLFIAFLVFLRIFIYIYLNKGGFYNIIKFSIFNIVSKILPLLSLCLLNLNKIDDEAVYFTIALVIVYLIYMKIMGITFYDFYAHVINTYLNDKNYKTLKPKEAMFYDKIFGFVYEGLNAFFRKIIIKHK